MSSLGRLFVIIFGFTILFFGLRTFGSNFGYNVGTLVGDLGGLAYLYSTVGTIFAIFAGFVIVSESQDWNKLNEATKAEIRNLREMLLWSAKLPAGLAKRFSDAIARYLQIVVGNEWGTLEKGQTCAKTDLVILDFHNLLIEAGKADSDLASNLFSALSGFIENRAIRIEYSWQPLPTILKFTVTLVALSVMTLSLLIGVRNTWLDYIFTLCIVTLVSVILMVVDDLDNPLRPGEWYLSDAGHRQLLNGLQQIERKSQVQNAKNEMLS